MESQRAQQCSKCTVQLVTETAAAPLYKLASEGILVERNLSAEGDVEILERNSQQMGAMNRAQRVEVCSGRISIVYALEIGIHISHSVKTRSYQ